MGENILNLEDELERCKPWIEAALEYTPDTHVFDDIVDGIRKGTLQLWATPKGCIITEIICYPRRKKLHVFLGGGELEQIMDMHADVVKWAKLHGCSSLTMTGRFGWKKPLATEGWKSTHALYEKEF